MKHKLSGSEYPQRVSQCKEALEVIKKKNDKIQSLRDVTLEILESSKSSLSALAYKRAKHNVTENIRTWKAAEALKKNDFVTVGKMMSESHDSLATDFEVSCPELDILKTLALEIKGVYGSRMTGGGFGGCTVTLVNKSAVKELKEHIQKEYLSRTGLKCEFYECVPSAGAGFIEEDTNPFFAFFPFLLLFTACAACAIFFPIYTFLFMIFASTFYYLFIAPFVKL